MDRVERIIEIAAGLFREKLELAIATGGLSLDRYVRYLSMQYHLTNGVQSLAVFVSRTSRMPLLVAIGIDARKGPPTGNLT